MTEQEQILQQHQEALRMARAFGGILNGMLPGIKTALATLEEVGKKLAAANDTTLFADITLLTNRGRQAFETITKLMRKGSEQMNAAIMQEKSNEPLH